MAMQDKNTLKSWFNTGEYVTQAHCEDWMDSYLHKDEELDILSNFPKLKQVVSQKASKEVLPTHINNHEQPHQVTQEQLDLGKVDNIADADKPVSKPLESALSQKASKQHIHPVDTIDDIDKSVSGYNDTTAPSQRVVKNYLAAQLPLLSIKDSGTIDTPMLKFPKGELLSSPKNGAWECDGRALYFTHNGTRKSVTDEGLVFRSLTKRELFIDVASAYSKATPEVREQKLALTTSTAINPILPGTFDDHGVTQLKALVDIDCSNLVGKTWISIYIKGDINTKLVLKITNGHFSNYASGDKPYTSLTIAEIHGSDNTGLKAIELPIVTNYIDVPGQQPLSSLMLFGINDSSSTFEFTIPEVYLRDTTNSRALKASEAAFDIIMKGNLTAHTPCSEKDGFYKSINQKNTTTRIN